MVSTRQTNPGWLGRLLKRYESGEVLALGWPVGTDKAALRYPDGTSMLTVVASNQFGTTNIPQRDFMHPGGLAAFEATRGIREAGVKAVNAGKATPAEVLATMGPFAESALKKTIADFTTPGNAQSTIARKGDDNPLEDTRLMVQSVTHMVRAK